MADMTEFDPAMLVQQVMRTRRYPASTCRSLRLDTCPEFTYIGAAQHLITQESPLLRAVGWYALGRCIQRNERLFFNGEMITERDAFIEALRYDESLARAYNALATTIGHDESVTLYNGECLTKRSLLLKTMRHDPSISDAYSNLYRLMKPDETIELPCGQTVTRAEVLEKAFKCDPAETCYSLSLSMGDDMLTCTPVVLAGAEFSSRRQLLLAGLDHDPTYANLYFGLAGSLKEPRDQVLMPDGRSLNKLELYLEILRLNPDHQLAYHNLACNVGDSSVVVGGRSLNQVQLFLEALRCDPTLATSYFNIALLSGSAGCTVVRVPDGRSLTIGALYLEALRYEPSNEAFLARFKDNARPDQGWSRWAHTLVYGGETNVLFATLLLGLQRLETAGLLPPAHHSMLEDMLELAWTWGDAVFIASS